MRIISNTAISLDGRISTAKKNHIRLGSAEDLKRMSVIRNRADAVLVGGATFRQWPHPLLPNPRHVSKLKRKFWWNVVVSRSAEPCFTKEFFKNKKVKTHYLGGKKRSPHQIVKELKKYKIKTLLLECGGDLLFQFLKAGLLDEMYLTLCPKIIGERGASTLADGEGFLKNGIKKMKLLSYEAVGHEIFLHYKS